MFNQAQQLQHVQYIYKLYWQQVWLQYLQIAVDSVPLCENKEKINNSYNGAETTAKTAYITQDTKANNLITNYSFNQDRGFMTNILTSGLQNNLWYNYSYDQLGNLKKRADINQNLSEYFYYDGLNRMTQSARHSSFGVNCGAPPTPVESKTISYNSKGNITQKDGQSYSYQNASTSTKAHKYSHTM